MRELSTFTQTIDLAKNKLNFRCKLKWYYAQFSLQKLGYNCYVVQKIATYNDEGQTIGNDICQI